VNAAAARAPQARALPGSAAARGAGNATAGGVSPREAALNTQLPFPVAVNSSFIVPLKVAAGISSSFLSQGLTPADSDALKELTGTEELQCVCCMVVCVCVLRLLRHRPPDSLLRGAARRSCTHQRDIPPTRPRAPRHAPPRRYWNKVNFQGMKQAFADGGGTDNLAITPLIRRKVGAAGFGALLRTCSCSVDTRATCAATPLCESAH
jgi:hypothetical protein